MTEMSLHPLLVVEASDDFPGTMGVGVVGPASSSFASDGLNPQIQVPSHHRQRPVRSIRAGTIGVTWPTRATTPPHGNIFIFIAFMLACCCSITHAEATPVLPDEIHNPLPNAPPELHAQLDELATAGTILFDQNPHPGNNYWEFAADSVVQEDLLRRQNDGDLAATPSSITTGASTGAASTNASSHPAPTPSLSASSTVASPPGNSSAPASTASAVSSPIPSPFDSSLGANFTAPSCPDYITSFLNNATFKSCLPFSLLLESSNSFFQAEKSIVRITQTLDVTCAANVTFCTSFLSSLAAGLTATANCGADYVAQNPTVMQAYTGLLAYKPLYQASCLKNPASGAYCFADAVTNSTSPEDSYVYYLALNTSLPGGSQPTCNTCLQNTMAVFSAAASNRSQPVASTFVSAAQQINVNCGPNFVNATIPAPVGAAGGRASLNPLGSALVLAMFIMAWLM